MSVESVKAESLVRWIGIALTVVPAVLVVAVGLAYSGEFQKFFSDFNVELPPLTRFTYDWYPWTLTFVVLIAPLVLLTKDDSNKARFRVAAWSGLLVVYAVYLFWLVVMGVGLYLPFYKVSQVQ